MVRERAGAPDSSAYGPALARVLDAVKQQAVNLARERAEAPALCEELIRHPQTRRLTLVRNSRQYQTWGLCELLVDKSFESRSKKALWRVQLAEVAVAVAEQLDPEFYGPRQVQDLRGRAWAQLGNVRRMVSDLREADKAFSEAQRCFDEGAGDPLDHALLSRFRAHLMRARRRFDEAHRLHNRALSIYGACGQTDLVAQVLSDQGVGVLYSGHPERAIHFFEGALEALEEISQPRLVAAAKHNLAYCLNDLGRRRKALQVLTEVRPIYRELGDRMNLLRVRWVEGKILLGLGRIEEAEKAFVEVRQAFVEEEIAYDAALVSLDLAAVYAEQGRTAEMRRLAAEMLPIFESRDVHREALAALIIFRQAAEAERASLALVQEIAAYLQKARHDPTLRFRSSS